MLPLYIWQIPVSHVMIHLYTFFIYFFAYIRTSILMYHKVGLELRFVSLFVQLLKEVGFFFLILFHFWRCMARKQNIRKKNQELCTN